MVPQVGVQLAPDAPSVEKSVSVRPIDTGNSAGSQVPLSDAPLYVGRPLRISAVDGLTTMATLKEIQGDVFVFEQKIGGGAMTFKLRREEIGSLSTR